MWKKVGIIHLAAILIFTLTVLSLGTRSSKVWASEEGNPTVTNWSFHGSGGVVSSYAIDSNEYHLGGHSLRLTNESPLSANVYFTASQAVSVEPNTDYVLSVWVKGMNVNNTWFGGAPGWSLQQGVPAGSYDWQQVTTSYTTGSNEHSFDFRILTENTTDSVWFDDLSMVKSGSGVNLLQNAGFEKQLQSEAINGFNHLSEWTGDSSAAGNAAVEIENTYLTEGTQSARITYNVHSEADGYINFYWNPVPKLNLAKVDKLLIDIYPMSQTAGADEPLTLKISGDSGVVYESALEQLIANQWNTVEIDLASISIPKDQISMINLFIHSKSDLEGRTSVTYLLDNMRSLIPMQVKQVMADQVGEVSLNSAVQLSSETLDSTIYYTVDGTDPRNSGTRTTYSQPIIVDKAMLIRAYATATDLVDSAVSDYAYTLGTDTAGETFISLNHFDSTLGSGKYASVFNATEGMEMNGLLDEWDSFTGISLPSDNNRQVIVDGWSGKDDLSANAKFAYDQDALYVSVAVKDNIHEAVAGDGIWMGDSVQIAFSQDGNSYGPEYGFALVNGQPDIWRWSNGNASLDKEAVVFHSVRSLNVTSYEAKIPWKAIFAAGKPDHRFRAELLVNDNDGNGRRGWIEWTGGIGNGKDASRFAVLDLVQQNEGWGIWFDGKVVLSRDETSMYVLQIPNYSDHEITLNLNSSELGLDRTITIPAQTVLKKKIEITRSEPGIYPITVAVYEAASGISKSETLTLKVDHAQFDELAAKMPILENLLLEAKELQIPTDYEQVNATVIRNFIEYGKEDAANGMLERSFYVIEQLDKLYDEAVGNLQGYIDGSKHSKLVPRYMTGLQRPTIHNYSFIANTFDSTTSQTEQRPVFFTGYGHFEQVRQDIPQFEGYGTNIVQIEIGPDSVIRAADSLYGWTVNATNGVQAKAKADWDVYHSGEAALLLTNSTPLSPNKYISVMQNITVKPNTTYEFSAWVKGQHVKDVWFPGGKNWDYRMMFPSGTYDWTEITYEYTTGANETSFPFVILSENEIGKVWIDDVSMTAQGSTVNLLTDPGFENNAATDAGEDYNISTAAIKNDIQRVLQNASDHNIAVNLLLSPHYFPAWALEKWPELKTNGEGWIKFDIDAPKAREIMETYLRTIIPLVKDYPSLHSITISNEPAYFSAVDPINLPKWHTYLSEIYEGDIGALNQIYGTNYVSFDEVGMPPHSKAVPLHAEPTPQFYDWVIFNNKLFSDWHSWMAGIIHEIDANIPIHSKVMDTSVDSTKQLTWGTDPEQFSELSQINGNDNSNYWGQGKDGFLSELKFYDMQTSFKKAPVFNSENHVIRDGDKLYIPEQANHVRSVLWQDAVHGQSATTIWSWERSNNTTSDFYGSILHRPDVVAAVGKTNLDLNRLAYEVTALQEDQAEVAILYSIPSAVFAPKYYSAVTEAYEAISLSGLKVGFLSEKQLKEGRSQPYKYLIIPEATHVNEETLAAIRDYAEDGRKVVIIGNNSLKFDERNQLLQDVVRSALMGSSNTILIPTDTSSEGIRNVLLPSFTASGMIDVMLIDAETDEPIQGTEWRSVKYDGKLLVNIVNYTSLPKEAYIMVNGLRTTIWTDLISGKSVTAEPMAVTPLVPYLLSIELPDEENQNPSQPGTGGNNNGAETTETGNAEGGTLNLGKVTFKDVQTHWAKGQIEKGVELGIVQGYSDGTFRPNGLITRAEFVTMLARALKLEGSNSEVAFTDSAQIPAWAAGIVGNVVEAGLIKGYEDQTFRPNQQISRAEIAVIIARAIRLETDADAELIFGDAKDIPTWATEAVSAAVNNGLLRGKQGNQLAPTAKATRAEGIVLLIRMLDLKP
ncbi:S-layer homology domain-containing protein [Paenibacillus sinopodophylli]|uniref:S-layer homology domain-containing protein n=1 Tax=Paenibacillus sinopodophylli TaxID=1837342 RepID=UPI00110CC557|nr:S-layer homology domain-containing protein [Paenibacillus sinopodophylli]